jgi:hypothetical protein
VEEVEEAPVITAAANSAIIDAIKQAYLSPYFRMDC